MPTEQGDSAHTLHPMDSPQCTNTETIGDLTEIVKTIIAAISLIIALYAIKKRKKD